MSKRAVDAIESDGGERLWSNNHHPNCSRTESKINEHSM